MKILTVILNSILVLFALGYSALLWKEPEQDVVWLALLVAVVVAILQTAKGEYLLVGWIMAPVVGITAVAFGVYAPLDAAIMIVTVITVISGLRWFNEWIADKFSG